jgi:hypothetical protein
MSELMNGGYKTFEWQLLTTVSALALLGGAYGASQAKADDDSGRPTVWIELGGQLSRVNDGEEIFSPSLMDVRPSQFSPSSQFEKMPHTSIDESGSASFQPDNSNWTVSASVRYGRSVSHTHVHQQTQPKTLVYYDNSGYKHSRLPTGAKFADTNTNDSEHHLIVDFQAGKDVGMGMFGKGSVSLFSLGVRFAQFGTNSNIALKSDPDWQFRYTNFYGRKLVLGGIYHSNDASLRASRGFHGIGPSLSWNASAPVTGNGQDSELAINWGVNAAVLFGRQRAQVHYQTTAQHHDAKYRYTQYHVWRRVVGHSSASPPTRLHSVAVPNIGGFAGISFRYANAKISFGYRADLFFGAMDGGIETRKSENVGFYGPVASVSIGLGG